MGVGVVAEVRAGPREAARQQQELAGGVGIRRGLGECVDDDALDLVDVDEVEGQGAGAGAIDALGAIASAQTQQLLGLAQLGPREGPGE